MMKLINGAKVLAAYIVPASPGLKERGVVLVDWNDHDYVVWTCYKEPDDEYWDTEEGSYFQKYCNQEGWDALRLAELSFGRRVHRFTTAGIHEGMLTL